MGAGDSKPDKKAETPPTQAAPSPKSQPKAAESPPKAPVKAPEPVPAPKAPTPTAPEPAPVAKAPTVEPPKPTEAVPTTAVPTTAVPTTAAEAAASIAAGPQGKEEEVKAKATEKVESKAKGKAKAKPKAKGEGEKTEKNEFQCCVRNLGEDATEEQLKTIFAPFGAVGTINMITKPDGKCRGLAFVSLGSAEEVTKAIAEMDKTSIDGKEISVALAERKEKTAASKDAKGKSKGKEKGEKGKGKGDWVDKGKGGKGKKGEDRRPSQQVGFVPPNAYGQQPMYGYQNPYGYPYGQYGYGQQAMSPQIQAQQLAQMQYMAQSMYAAQVAQQSMGVRASLSGAVQPGPVMGSVDTTEYTGTLKSLSSRNGYGFISWPENEKNKWYMHDDPQNKKGLRGTARNVYISAELLPDGCKAIGAAVKFTFALNEKGHPQASTCKAA